MLKILWKIIKVAVTVFALLIISLVLIQRIFNNDVSLFGYRMFTVVTGSMDPVYKVMDTIISKEVDASKIKVGDDVVYVGKEGSFDGKIVTHRVIDIENQDGKLVFTTKGVANTGVDPLVYEDQIYGIVLGKSNILTFMGKLVANPFGFIILVMLPASFLIASEIADRKPKE